MTLKTLAEVSQLAQVANVIPIYKELLGDLETPISALMKLKAKGSHHFLLESVEGGHKIARFSFLGKDPIALFKARGNDIQITGFQNKKYQGQPLEELKTFFSQFKGQFDPHLPNFSGGGVGYIAYDAIRLVENIPDQGADDFQIPDIYMGVYDHFLVFDNIRHSLLLVANVITFLHPTLEEAYTVALEKIKALEVALSQNIPQSNQELPTSKEISANYWKSNHTAESYQKGVERCKEYILAGDAFQIVLSQRFESELKSEPLQIYRSLRTINPSPYMYYLQLEDLEIVGASPELLVKVHQRTVETRPIAGSRPRGKTLEEDTSLAEELLQDQKERAEHVMLIDLGRNDLGRVCEYGTVKVTELMQIEKYSHIMHIVSNVQGQLRPEVHCLEALMSCFPAGTLSGAPKIRAMEIIDELEPTRRGLYGGAICYLDFQGNLDSCIAIRTMLAKNKKAYVQAGAGIVADSHPPTEYLETCNKAAAMMRAIENAGKLL